MKLKHFRLDERPFAWAFVISLGIGLFAATSVAAQDSSTQKSSSINVVTEAEDKSQLETLPIEIVTHVDAMPPFTEKAIKILREYRINTVKESGNKRIDILQQVGRPNHFSIVEEWENQKFFNEHEKAPHTRQFRADMQEALGAPFDERPHHFIAP